MISFWEEDLGEGDFSIDLIVIYDRSAILMLGLNKERVILIAYR